MENERIGWIDIARGIGIIAVLYGHGLDAQSYRHIIYAFHIPLFFFLSGVVFHVKKHEGFLTFVKKSFLNILVPYFLFASLSYILWLTTSSHPGLTITDVLNHVKEILFANGKNALSFNVVLWFLPCLFVTRIFFALIATSVKKKRFILPALFVISVIGYVIATRYSEIKLPLGIETALTAVVFFGGGYVWNMYHREIDDAIKKHLLIIFSFTFLAFLALASIHFEIFNHQIDLRLNRLDNYLLFYTTTFSGIISCILLSVIINKNRILEYLGKHSLILFVWHLVVFSYFTRILFHFVDPATVQNIRNPILAPTYTALATGIILAVNSVLYKTKILPIRNK